ncbi:MAG: carboxynorspermidine decarboxylase, partial [Lachnospiraceae bacterium]|nr:carboxynorspermidine decarboxylase [Lachnospiraceae bacterium]
MRHNINEIPTPFYIVYEEKLRRNLSLIHSVAERAGVDIIMAFKANALWKTFPIIREYITGSTASSLNEMLLGVEELHSDVHAYCPVYTHQTFPLFLKHCSHITFNTLAQFHEFYPLMREKDNVSAGIRVNPQCSVIDTDIYNPCVPGSRFGMTDDTLPDELPEGIDGLHFHALCESSAQDLATVLAAFESQFGKYLPHVKWVNMGGGHLMTREDYDTKLLIRILQEFKQRWPHIKVILEPGSAFTWRTGDLITTIMDVVENQGVSTAIIDASFACHMPDTLEMPYKPIIAEAL